MALGLGRFFGFLVPQIPEEYLSDANDFLNSLNDESSVASYDHINSIAMSTDGEQGMRSQTVRGGALREFELFLHEHDPKCFFSGLRRLLISNDGDNNGTCCWTSESNYITISSNDSRDEGKTSSNGTSDFGQSVGPLEPSLQPVLSTDLSPESNKNITSRSTRKILSLSRLKQSRLVYFSRMSECCTPSWC